MNNRDKRAVSRRHAIENQVTIFGINGIYGKRGGPDIRGLVSMKQLMPDCPLEIP